MSIRRIWTKEEWQAWARKLLGINGNGEALMRGQRQTTIGTGHIKRRIAQSVETFVNKHYELRYNMMKQTEEFRPLHGDDDAWQPLTDRELRAMAFLEMKDGGEAWLIDMELYARSGLIRRYHPLHDFLSRVGAWDGNTDYIGAFARRIPTDYPDWQTFFHRWMLAMVAQWQGRNRDYGNAVVPMLIGPQGTHKTTFCRLILPPSLREYFIDDVKMDNAEQVERMLSRMALVNIDEYNSKTAREQAKIKRLLTEREVQTRKMRSDQYHVVQRQASFIATTNDRQPLTDPTGLRRYLCVEVQGMIDTDTPVNYQGMYAQAVAELERGDLYHFTKVEERQICLHNELYQRKSVADTLLSEYFEPAPRNHKNLWTTTEIQTELSRHLRPQDLPTLSALSAALKSHFPHGSVNGRHGWYVWKRE